MRNYIKVSQALRIEMAEKFNSCPRTVTNALSLITAGDKANAIRAYALEHGGKLVSDDFIPNCSTTHTPDRMIQTFPCGVVVTVFKGSGNGRLELNDSLVESYDKMTVDAWTNVLAKAQNLSDAIVRKNSQM